MPPHIGRFISDAVYEGRLKSNPLHPVTEDVMACHFIDVNSGREQREGDSYKARQLEFWFYFAMLIRCIRTNSKNKQFFRSHGDSSAKEGVIELSLRITLKDPRLRTT